ncbi:hypothetical protein [uncultured Clostridium sp.]|uniref:hypothetical protein n=1 Tax=uncultured Clostridium sp. TaxID=59620 RepID=UPI00280A8EBC|nr:hypothetical protein [uncultured Clostridium sp.]
MKKILIALIVLTLSLGVVGCTSDKEETASNSNEVVTQEESKEEKKRSSDEMYELYTSKLEEVEKFFKENNIDFKQENNYKNTKYDGKTTIAYENSENNIVGEFSIGRYGIAFDNDGNIRYITARLALNVNDEEMKTKEFKFEETEFYKLHNILISEIENTDEINDKVTVTYKDLTSINNLEIENGNIKEQFLLGDNSLVYDIIIRP